MSDYTMTLKRVCEVMGKNEVLFAFKNYNLRNYLSEEQFRTIEENSLFSPDILANLILDHYYFREIAYETPAMFLHFAQTKMREIMRKLCSYYLFFIAFIQPFRR